MKNQILTKVALSLILLIGLLASLSISALAAPGPVTGCRQVHTVKPGDYITRIADIYGVNWRALADLNRLEDASLIFPGNVLCISTTSADNVSAGIIPTSSAGIQVFAASVVEDQTVTLQGRGLAAETMYTVYMSNYKVQHATTYLAGTVLTDKNGAFTRTLALPKQMIDVPMVRVSLANSRGVFTANWFFNTTASGNTGGVGTPAITLTVDQVKKDGWVKITASNLPQNVTFDVFMGKAGSQGLDGVYVGKMIAAKSGRVSATFQIPEELWGRSRLDISLQSNAMLMATLQQFENKTDK